MYIGTLQRFTQIHRHGDCTLETNCVLSIQVYAGLFEYKPYLTQIKGKLLDAYICTLSRLTTLVRKKKKNTKWKFNSRLSQSNTMWSRAPAALVTILKQPCIWYCRTFSPFQTNLSVKSIKAMNTVKERMTLQHTLCSLYGLCPSISEYLKTPEEKNKW